MQKRHREYLTPPAVANALGISADKVRSWIAEGQLGALNVASRTGGRPRWRIPPAELERFKRNRSSQSARKCPTCRRREMHACALGGMRQLPEAEDHDVAKG